MQNTSCEMPGWILTSWNQDCQENNLRNGDDTLMAEKPRGTKEPLNEGERGE